MEWINFGEVKLFFFYDLQNSIMTIFTKWWNCVCIIWAPSLIKCLELWTHKGMVCLDFDPGFELCICDMQAIADTLSFIFLWVGDGVGLEQGRQCLKKVSKWRLGGKGFLGFAVQVWTFLSIKILNFL